MRPLSILLLLLLLVLWAGPAFGADAPVDTTVGEFYGWPEIIQIPWVGGAFAGIGLAVGCPAGTNLTVRAMVDMMKHRYLVGTAKGSDKAVILIVKIMTDQNCWPSSLK